MTSQQIGLVARMFTLLLLLPGSMIAQCMPVAPTGSWPVAANNAFHFYTDGYQVEMVVRAPNIMPPPCGWPMVVCVHGGGGSKAAVAGTATSIASRGYCTVAYDVRGQGPSMGLNNPALFGKTSDGVRELIDLFEIMEAAEAVFPNQVDFDRIGVTGYSQGGRHAWMAAVNSGRLPPPNPWRQAAFPTVSCAVPKDAAGPGFGLGDGLAIGHHQLTKLFGGGGGTWYQPVQAAQMRNWILAEDFAAVANARHVPALDPAVLLPACQVPVFGHASYDDYRINTNGILTAWQLLPPAPPKRLQGGTGGHSSPNNARDESLFNQTRMRWLDRFLKGIANGVETGDPMRLSVTPDSVSAYQSSLTLRDFRRMSDVPAPPTATRTLYLDSAGQLSAVAPVAVGSSSLTHVVPAAMNMAAYTAAPPSAAGLIAAFGLNSLTWDSAALVTDWHLQGKAELELNVSTPDPRFQIHAVLFDVDPGGNARYVTDGQIRVYDNLPAGANVLGCSLYLQSYVFRAGHSIRIQLENLVIHRPPTGSGTQIRIVPAMQGSTVNIDYGGALLSRLELPILPFPGPRLVTYPLNISTGAPADHRFAIHSSSARAGDSYLLLLSLAGTSPGVAIPGGTFPLNPDFLTFLILGAPNGGFRIDFAGNLGPTGSATSGMALGGVFLPAALVGTELYGAALVSLGATMAVTNPVAIPFTL